MASRRALYQLLVLVLTFISYAIFHVARKILSTVKYDLQKDWGMDPIFLGTLDTIFMIIYALGLFVSGQLGDRFSPKMMIVVGMILTAVFLSLFGAASPLSIHSQAYFVTIWGCNALVQTSGWPNNVAIMGKWFDHGTRGTVYGIWGANASVGNILGSVISGAILAAHAPWPYVFYAAAGLCFSGGLWLLFLLPASPEDVGEQSIGAIVEIYDDPINAPKPDEEEEVEEILAKEKESQSITILQGFMVPGVLAYSLSYACTKLVNYALFFWLPYYLTTGLNYGPDVAALLSTWYDVGGIIGGTIGGFLSDVLIRKLNIDRSFVLLVMLLISTGQLYCYFQYAASSWEANVGLMIGTGIFIGGPANIISAAVSADLGTHKDIKGNKEALATVTGIIDGTASAGAAVGQVLVAYISSKLGWEAVFYFFMIMTTMGGLILIFPAYRSRTNREILPPPINEGEDNSLVHDYSEHYKKKNRLTNNHHHTDQDEENPQTTDDESDQYKDEYDEEEYH